MSEPRVLEHSVQGAREWLDELAAELGSEDRAHAHRVLRAHLHAIRDRISVEEVAQLGAQLPQLIRGIYYDGWAPARTPASYRTADEFVARIEEEAGLGSAAEASAACLAASRVLRRRVSAGEIEDVIAVLPAELRPMLAGEPAPDRAQPAAAEPDAEEPVIGFARVVCGIDPSPQAAEALRQASAVSDGDARILGVCAWDTPASAHGSHERPQLIEFVRDQAAGTLAAAREQLPRLETRLVRGPDVHGVLDVVAEERADLLAVGSHSHSRPAGIAFGSVATAAVHEAPCSVLIARHTGEEGEGGSFPDRIVLAVDGSDDSRLAATIAARIAARHGSTLIALHVQAEPSGERIVTEETAALIEAAGVEPVVEVCRGKAHRRIVEVAGEDRAALVVLGSRGLTGVRALGSVSERVAHQAPCSVLVVRGVDAEGPR